MNDLDLDIFDAEEFSTQIIDPGLRRKMIEAYPAETGEYLGRAAAALEQHDAEQLHLAAHSLKGVVGNYLGTSAFSAATELDRLARRNNLTAAAEAFAVCRLEVEKLGKALNEFLRGEKQKTGA